VALTGLLQVIDNLGNKMLVAQILHFVSR
jgi:hypothetical protein